MTWAVGQELKPIEKPAITREQLTLYAEASGDDNPIHLDDKFAREAGFPSVIVHGMISMGFMADMVLVNFPRKSYALLSLRTKFKRVTFPGDRIRCIGKVRKVEPDGTVVVSLSTLNQSGEATTDGEARLRPSAS